MIFIERNKSYLRPVSTCDRYFDFNPFCLEKRLRHRNVARAWKKKGLRHFNFFQPLRQITPMELFHFLTNSVEALLKKVWSQRVQVETGLYFLLSLNNIMSFFTVLPTPSDGISFIQTYDGHTEPFVCHLDVHHWFRLNSDLHWTMIATKREYNTISMTRNSITRMSPYLRFLVPSGNKPL